VINLKKISLILSLTLLSILLLGCQQESEIKEKSYSSEEAIENGDVVNLHGEISNLDRF